MGEKGNEEAGVEKTRESVDDRGKSRGGDPRITLRGMPNQRTGDEHFLNESSLSH